MILRALGGGELKGEKLVQFIYLDESGTGSLKDNPYAVVAGVIVDPDRQAIAIKTHLSELVQKYVPPEHRIGFRFHAKELILGGKVFSRSDKNLRMEILTELCAIPKKFDLPVFAGKIDRVEEEKNFHEKDDGKSKIAQVLAAATFQCLLQVEDFMRTRAGKDELAILHFENNELSKRLIKNVLKTLSNDGAPSPICLMFPDLLPIHRIMPEVSFLEKQDSYILQLADICAWAIRRDLSRQDKSSSSFINPILDQLLESTKYCLSL